MYKVIFKESVERDLKKIHRPRINKIRTKIHKELAMDPYKKGSLLKGKWEGLRKYESHPYRVIYSILEGEKTILILRIRHRKEVYRSG